MPPRPKSYEQGVEDGRRDALVQTLQGGLNQIRKAMADGLKTVHDRINAIEEHDCKPRADRLTRVEDSLVWMRRIAGGIGIGILAVVGWLIYVIVERSK